MKNLILLVGMTTTMAGAYAQASNVTLFGIVDAQVRYVKNGDAHTSQLASNGLSSSRLGFRGVEDLGDGLKAGFWLEHGFNVDTGTQADATRFWNRRSTVSLIGKFGEVRLGRDYTPTYTAVFEFDPFGDNGVASVGKFLTTLGTNVDTNSRADNQITYLLPESLGGVYGRASVAAGEGAAGKRYAGARVGYRSAKLDATLAYGETKVTPLTPGADTFKSLHVGVAYDFGVVKLSGLYGEKRYSALKVRAGNIGVTAPIGLWSIRASYTKVDTDGALPGGASTSPNDANQFGLGVVYALSKRTALYATAARIDNKQRAAYVVGTPPALPSPNNGADSSGYEFGLRHAF